MIGTVIEQYRITRRLGGGGMGEVFLATDLELDREVAIKCVRPELSDLDEVAARFRAEARTLANLAHANIATVYRFFANEGQLFLVMEYISGKPFGDMLIEEGSQPAGRVVNLVRQALAGLGYAHQNKVVHRDIKPANLMLDGHDTVKVVDFGIAHLLDQTPHHSLWQRARDACVHGARAGAGSASRSAHGSLCVGRGFVRDAHGKAAV